MNETRMQWFHEDKYGTFIHWGLYSILGGRWKGERVSAFDGAEWIMYDAQIPVREYRKLADSFYARDFDADLMVRRIVEYGAKYLCFTAKHHDGFAMYDSKVSDYNIMHTPFGRDPLREIEQACRKYGIHFCIYYSQMQDWDDPNGYGNTWDYDAEKKDFRTYFTQKVKPQVRELLENYGKVHMIWFDTPYTMPVELCKELRELVLSIQPDCLISGRIGYGLGDFREMNDNNIPAAMFPYDWECPMTLNQSWGYSLDDGHWKQPKEVLSKMVTIFGKGGNLLLNIGPDADGNVPEESNQILTEVGAFLRQNGTSMYGSERMPDAPYLADWGGCTKRGNRLYLHVLHYPDAPYEIRIYNMKTKVNRVYLLQTGEELEFRQLYEIARDEYRFRIFLPEQPVHPLDTVVVAELDGELEYHDLRTIYERN